MLESVKEDLLDEIKILEIQKRQTGLTFEQELDISDNIHNIKMKLNGTKPTDSSIDCIGCGS